MTTDTRAPRVLGLWNDEQMPLPRLCDPVTGLWWKARCRCLFCGFYALRLRELIEHFDRQHGRVAP